MADLADIEREAIKLVKHLDKLDPPIRVSELIEKQWPKLFVGDADLGDYHGALVTDGGRGALYLSAQANDDQKNIILAHLAWHWIKQALKGQIDLTRQCLVHVARPEDPLSAVERDADMFASELLVPLEVLEKYIDFPSEQQTEQERAYVSRRITELAAQFAVPYEVMKSRVTLFGARRRSFRPRSR